MTTALAAAAALALCYPLLCEWSAPGFFPASSSAQVWSLPCPAFAASSPPVPGDYPVTLTVRCVLRPAVLSTATKVVTVLPQGFRDGFETGDTSRWSWRHP